MYFANDALNNLIHKNKDHNICSLMFNILPRTTVVPLVLSLVR